jgi:hypothetical protein
MEVTSLWIKQLDHEGDKSTLSRLEIKSGGALSALLPYVSLA